MPQKVEFKFSIAHLACRCSSASGTCRVMGHVVVPRESAAATRHRERALQEAGLLSPGCRKPGPGNGPIIV